MLRQVRDVKARACPSGMTRGCLGRVRPRSPVCGSDHSSQAFACGGEFVVEFADASLGVVGLGGAGVAFGGELAAGGFQGGDSADELGPVGSFDLGAEVEAQSAAELIAFGS